MDLDVGCSEVTVSSSPVGSRKEEPNDCDTSVSPTRSSPDPGCPICLGKLENKSFTDSCLHQFCFKCLLEWSKVKAECPLCKQSFKSIIHNVRSIEDYEQYYLSTTSTEGTLYVSREIFTRLESGPSTNYREPSNYRLRTTAVSSYLDYFVRLEEAISHRVLPPGPTFSGALSWQRRRQQGTSDFRRNIYQQGLWVQRTSDISGRVRECSPEFYRANPAQVHRLVPWLNRELNVLLYENSPHIQHVMSRILELITQVPIRSHGFAAVIGPYIGRHTEHFIHEFHNFAISPYDLVGYDRHANYVGRSDLPVFEDSAQDSDSDVQILEEGARATSPLIQLVDTDSDDCIVLDAPPRSEPEVITLDSDDDDVVQINIQTFQPSQSTSSQPSTSTSQPKPSTSQRPVRLKRNWLTVNKEQVPSTSSGSENINSCHSSSQRPVRLKRNWLTVNKVQVPTTSTVSENVNGCEISISIAHSSRSLSPTVSEASSASWVPVRRKPTKVRKKKKKKDTVKKGKCHKGKTSQPLVKVEEDSDREDNSSPDLVVRRRKTKPRAMTSSSSEDSSSDRTHTIDQKPFKNELQKRNVSVRSSISSGSDSDSDRMFVATTDSSTSSDEMEYKPRLKSVVVKTTHIKPEVQATSPTYFSSHSRSESYDHDLEFSPHRYLELPGSSRSRSDSYRSSYSYRSHRSPSSSVERLPNKRCKHSKKRVKREK